MDVLETLCAGWVIHRRNLKQALNHILVLKKVHKVIKFNQNALLKPRKLEIEGTLSAIFVTKTPRYDCCFVSLMQLIYMTLK